MHDDADMTRSTVQSYKCQHQKHLVTNVANTKPTTRQEYITVQWVRMILSSNFFSKKTQSKQHTAR